MKITGVSLCFLMLAAASLRADSFSFRDNYFKHSTSALPGLAQKGAHVADWDRNTWTFSAVNEGPQGFLSQIDPGQRPAKPVKIAQADRVGQKGSALPFIRPDETIDYKLSVRKPKAGTDYKLRLIPGREAETLR
jgi:hypothetical protein